MGAVQFSEITDLKRQAVEKKAYEFYENNDPGMKAFGEAVDKPPLTEKGYRLPNYAVRPTGETWFTPSNSDFNAAQGPQTVSMWVYPTMYAYPMIWTGSAIESMENDTADNIDSYETIMTQYTQAAQKRLEQYFYGDGSASLAYSATTTSTLGSQSLSCTTTAAATPGQTKGAVWLWPNGQYQAINTSTAQVRGTFTVTTAGTSSCTINLTSGSISSGDPIVAVGAYQMAMRGLGWLISDQTRVLQGLSTSAYSDLNAPVVDLNGALLTPSAIENAKALLQTRNNDPNSRNGLTAFLTPGQLSTIRKQGYNFSYYIRNEASSNTMKGVQDDYTDGDTRFIGAADMDDDRVYLAKTSVMKIYVMKKFGKYDRDGLQVRMLLGANNTGSDNWQSAMGTKMNPATLQPRATAFIKRAQLPYATSVSAGI
jgi:hypothetical protein